MTNSCHGMHLASRAFLLFAWFWHARERLCMNRVRSLLRMRFMLLGYSFEPTPNICVLATAGSVMTFGLSINGCSHSKNTFDKREHDWLVQKFELRRPPRFDMNSGRACFSPPQSQSRRQKKALLAGWMPLAILKKMCMFIGCGYQLSLRRYYIINFCSMNTLLLL